MKGIEAEKGVGFSRAESIARSLQRSNVTEVGRTWLLEVDIVVN